jgi:phosphohistidine phosphatase SixA
MTLIVTELLLVRHAIAFDRDSARWRDDRKRPLSPRGTARARKAAQGLRRLLDPPLRVLVSPLLRTRQTARVLSEFAKWPQPQVCTQLEPGRSPTQLLALLAGLRETRVAAIGHEPDLSRLLQACLGAGTRQPFQFRKMGVALVTFRGPVRPGAGTLACFLPPRVLRAVR